MKVALHDHDNNGYPNVALMKLSAWHKGQGDSVEFWIKKDGKISCENCHEEL